MSLIADALKKTNPGSIPQPPRPRTPRWSYGFLLLACGLLAVLLTQNIPLTHRSQITHTPTAKKSPAANRAASTNKKSGVDILRAIDSEWRLNGIVQGGPGKPLALVNNAIVGEGDKIPGARVVKVTESSVELETDGGTTKTIRLD